MDVELKVTLEEAVGNVNLLGSLPTSQGAHPLWQKLKSVAKSYGMQPSSVAIAWLLKHPAMIMPVMGSNDLQRIKQFSEALSIDLSREEWFELLQIATSKEVA